MFYSLPPDIKRDYPRIYNVVEEIFDSKLNSGYSLKISEYKFLKKLVSGWTNSVSFFDNLYKIETLGELQRIENILERYEKKNGLNVKSSPQKTLYKNRFEILDLEDE